MAFIWKFISGVVGVLAVVAIFVSALGDELEIDRDEFLDELHMSNGKAVIVILLIIVAIVAGNLFSIFMGYAAISIGQQFSRNKVLASVGIYFGMYFVINMVSNIFTQSLAFGLQFGSGRLQNWEPTENTYLIAFLIMDILMVAGSAGMYALINHFMKNKLNLE